MKNRKIDLEKKYLYLPMITKCQHKVQNYYEMIKQVNNKGLLEEVAIQDNQISSNRKELHTLKVKIMKDLILNNKPIPEKWIMREDYQQLLDEAMSDPIVLQYTVINADMYKKRAYPEECTKELHKKTLSVSKSVSKPFVKYQIPSPRYRIPYNSSLLFSSRNNTKRERSMSNRTNTKTLSKEKKLKQSDFMLTSVEEQNKRRQLPKIEQLLN